MTVAISEDFRLRNFKGAVVYHGYSLGWHFRHWGKCFVWVQETIVGRPAHQSGYLGARKSFCVSLYSVPANCKNKWLHQTLRHSFVFWRSRFRCRLSVGILIFLMRLESIKLTPWNWSLHSSQSFHHWTLFNLWTPETVQCQTTC
jgi:hypothetical protein